MKKLLLFALLPVCALAEAPKPYGPLPSERQLRWHETETFSLIHFGLNTMTDKEWGYGDVDPKVFNPVKLDAEQVVGALKRGGMKGVIFVAKHHDGFCYWPTKATDYNISKSPWKGGKGDLVREYADAAKKLGLLFGVYCSPWDRNNAEYARPAYVETYHKQITELLSNYGPMFEMWFDGANGGDGYYGGAKEKRKIDGDYYQWAKTYGIVRKFQPDACMFGGPDCRWVGNEDGHAENDTWDVQGNQWLPPECDVPLRPGWFWHANQKGQTRSPAKLMDIYFNTVGRAGCMNLGVAPDTDGLVCEEDCKSLDAFGAALKALFAKSLAADAVAAADKTREGFSPVNVLDGDRYSFWAPEDGVTNATLTLTLPEARTFDVVRIRENIKLGQRVNGFAVDVWENGAWQTYAQAKAIGACRLCKGQKVTTDKVRLRILGGGACPCISEFSLYLMPAL